LVVLVVVALLALVLYACSGSGSGKKQPVADGKSPSPGTSQSSVPASGGSSPVASGGASSATAGGPSGSAGGPTGSPGATGSAGSTATNGGTAGTGTTTGAGQGCQLALTLTSQSPAYANGDHPQFTVAVINKGSSDCDVDLSPKSLVLNVYSGGDHIWSSADCFTGDKDLRGIAPGGVQTVSYTWNRTRSAQGCPSGAAPAKLGMYYSVVSLAAGSSPSAPAAQSQPKNFELKTGS
jgi:hypothetical protein